MALTHITKSQLQYIILVNITSFISLESIALIIRRFCIIYIFIIS